MDILETGAEQPSVPSTFGPLLATSCKDGSIYVALLDGTGRLVGYDHVPEWKDGDVGVPVPEDCDLRPRHYRYDVMNKVFVPIDVQGEEQEKAAHPDALIAFTLGFEAIAQSGKISLPQKTLDWIEWYKTTIDYVAPK